MTEIAAPTVVRRTVAFAEAVWDGETVVEGVTGVLVASAAEARAGAGAAAHPGDRRSRGAWCGSELRPLVVVDAIVAKRNLGTRIGDAPAVIALGPGFVAGVDAHAVVETMRGHTLGRVIHEGAALPNTGIPGEIGGRGAERVLRAPVEGRFEPLGTIGDRVKAGDVVALVEGQPVVTTIDGVLRGLLRAGIAVTRGFQGGRRRSAGRPRRTASPCPTRRWPWPGACSRPRGNSWGECISGRRAELRRAAAATNRRRKGVTQMIEFLEGNDAVVRAAIDAGCRFFAGYPITPATSILTGMMRELPKVGGVAVQGEDEITSIGMCIAAAMTGHKAMTATSGPGLSLYSENIGLAIMGETPLVIVDVQRQGPATGSATKGADSDIEFMRWGTSGGLPVIVLSPENVAECYSLTIEAFNLAERFRTPVFLASQKEVGLTRERVDLAEVQGRGPGRAGTPGARSFDPVRAPRLHGPGRRRAYQPHRRSAAGALHDEHARPAGLPGQGPRGHRRVHGAPGAARSTTTPTRSRWSTWTRSPAPTPWWWRTA